VQPSALLPDPGKASLPVPLNGDGHPQCACLSLLPPFDLPVGYPATCSGLAGVHTRQISETPDPLTYRDGATRCFRSPLGLRMYRDNYLVGNGRSVGGLKQLLGPNSTIAATTRKGLW
jgi:hypothetical protein